MKYGLVVLVLVSFLQIGKFSNIYSILHIITRKGLRNHISITTITSELGADRKTGQIMDTVNFDQDLSGFVSKI